MYFTRRVFQILISGLAVLVGLSFMQPSVAETSRYEVGPIGEPLGELNMQVWRVPVDLEDGGGTITLEATVFRPDGDGPFPLAIFTHGAEPNAPTDGPYDFRPDTAIRWFMSKGYAVAALVRRGYGRSEGQRSVLDGLGWPELLTPHRERANDINSAAKYFRDQPFVEGNRMVMVGLSAGGNGVLAAASENPKGVQGVIAFVPGGGAINRNELEDRDLTERAFRAFGATNKLPVLWVYPENDQFYSPKLARIFFEAYAAETSAEQELVILPLEGEDGHDILLRDDGPQIWGAAVDEFLDRVMP
ncbi:hypothetical protein GCM10007094_40770 [Pseudovibrio japonicus]|uniref:Xaa-Pro dipeptidyl-peptidase-like domain-containing protein n=1 Tax=Pseudovibrio japonicus TaxID=366534 RepID=A0ABQ3EVM0_9HYPH|nr:alpha/beta hydrolase [Pseudovibrio japonicus]GHB47344.1 hypothetical protein GCM10007094_40770 [Pseudovibrio japonicus]